jgi:hypothetical protein
MWLKVVDAQHFLECQKCLVGTNEWKRVENREGRAEKHTFEARIAIDGILPRGLWFRIVVYPRYPNTATFQLSCERIGSRSQHTLYRLEWRPLSPHLNGFHGPPELQGMPIPAGQTHEHSCLDHVAEAEGRIRSGDVQCARPIEPDFPNFAAALAFVCDKLKIKNCGDIPSPADQGSLF